MSNYLLKPHIYLKEESSFDHAYIDSLTLEQAVILAKDVYLLHNFQHLEVSTITP
jgi:hypothetical protein